jgi:YVTN family beta-propeller protein
MITELPLTSPGRDWAVGLDPPRLYVAEQGARHVAVIDSERWQRLADAALTDPPGQMQLQHDGRYLWVAAARDGGVVALDIARGMTSAVRIATGGGSHRLALTADDRFLLVTNQDEGTVSVIDVAGLSKAREIQVGKTPGPIAISALAGIAYVAVDGAIVAIDPERDVPVARIEGVPGITALGITLDGRWGFAASPLQDRVTIFDTVTNRVAQTVTVANGPYEIGFTDAQAYIRRRDSEIVTVIPLAPLRADGRSAGLAEFPVGEKPAAADTSRTLTAASMVAAPGEAAMLLASAGERAVRYYREGMAAPADSFDTFGHQTIAVTIVDRSLRQTAPGTYSAVTRLARAGSYDLVVLLDKPRVAHCFAFDVAARSGDTAAAWTFEPVTLPQTAPAGRPVTLSFRVVRRSPSEHMPEPSAITALTILAPGSWHERVPMVRAADGTWGMQFVPPAAGIYLLAFEAPRQGIHVDAGPHFTIDVTEPEPPQGQHE